MVVAKGLWWKRGSGLRFLTLICRGAGEGGDWKKSPSLSPSRIFRWMARARFGKFPIVQSPVPHLADFQLAQKCLDGDEPALAHFANTLRAPLVAFLLRGGASKDAAEEIVTTLQSDCTAGAPGKLPLLTQYEGMSALATWLNTTAFNRLLSLRRAEQRWQRLIPCSTDDERDGEAIGAIPESGGDESTEPPLLEILRTAVQSAFAASEPEDFVLLQLFHRDGLRLAEIAKMFRCSEATISRRVERAANALATAALARVKAIDPLIELTWEDFRELCRVASPSALGVD